MSLKKSTTKDTQFKRSLTHDGLTEFKVFALKHFLCHGFNIYVQPFRRSCKKKLHRCMWVYNIAPRLVHAYPGAPILLYLFKEV